MSETTQDKNMHPIMQWVTGLFCLFTAGYYIHIGKLETTDLNWLPTATVGYTDTFYVYSQASLLFVICISVLTLVFGLKKKKLLLLTGATSLGLMLSLGGTPYNVATNMTRTVGLESGVAKVECWLPQSYECNVYSKGKEPDAKYPRIWTDSGVAQWAKDELAKTSSTD